LQLSSYGRHGSFTVSLREVAKCAGGGRSNSKPKHWNTWW
jgi:hypothetical protein